MSELGAAAAHPDYPMWSSLLRWSLAQGSDGTSASPQGPMSEEKRKFLEGALKAMGEDGAERQRAIFEAVQKFVDGTGDADACVDALEQLEDDAQDLDAARDLLKVGMLGLVLKAVDADDAAVSAAACERRSVEMRWTMLTEEEIAAICEALVYELRCEQVAPGADPEGR